MALTEQKTAIAHLFSSKSKTSHILGMVILATVFLPSVFQALDDENLTVWQRAEKVVLAAGQTLITAAVAGVDPKDLDEEPEPEPSSSDETLI